MAITLVARTPLYYARRRFVRNRPAGFGLGVIGVCVVVTLLGYWLMPDQTPNANDSAVQIQKQPPGFRVQLLKLRKNAEVPTVPWWARAWTGQESAYTLVPITNCRLEGLTAVVTLFGAGGRQERYNVADAVLPLYIGDSPLLADPAHFEVKGAQIRYVDAGGQLQTIGRAALLQRFGDECLETRHYWLGTDKAGRDMLSRLLFGVRISLGIGALAVLIALVVGVSLGAVAGYFGGRVDQLVMWLMTVIWSVPSIMLVIAITLALQSRGVWVAFVAVGLTMWVEIARVVRGQVMGIKQKLYVEAARAVGIGNRALIVRHILPNLLGPLIVIVTANFATAILTEAGLSFLGMGVQPPMPSWGIMVNEGFNALGSRGSGHLVVLPSLCISGLVLAFNLLGNGLRDALDPQQRG